MQASGDLRHAAAPRNFGPALGYASTGQVPNCDVNNPQPPVYMKLLSSTLILAGGLALGVPAFANDADDKFKMMDTNGDGSISRAEHASGAQSMFGKMDANADGTVSATEMEAGMTEKKSSKLKFWEKKDKDAMSASEKISMIDTNGDGQISRAEHEAGSEKMFTKMDTNDDGSLSKDECEAGHKGMKKDK
jgi:Ca2+-binding EF-hand superfamily protein